MKKTPLRFTPKPPKKWNDGFKDIPAGKFSSQPTSGGFLTITVNPTTTAEVFMADLFRDVDLTLTCGHCQHQFKAAVATLETSPTLACPACGTRTKYEASELRDTVKRANAAVDELKRTIKNIR